MTNNLTTKTLIILTLCISLSFINGCTDNTYNHDTKSLEVKSIVNNTNFNLARQSEGTITSSSHPIIIRNPTDSSTLIQLENKKIIRENLLENAYKEYIKAYNNYVKMLRESGPQTLETLNALAEYQKKYQLYLIIKKADQELSTLNSSTPQSDNNIKNLDK